MIRFTSLSKFLVPGVAIFALIFGASAAQAGIVAIQFDLSTTAGSYTTGQIAPAYPASASELNYNSTNTIANLGGVGALQVSDGTTWNAVDGASSSSLKYADGTTATGVTYTSAYGNATTSNTLAAWQYAAGPYGSIGSSTSGIYATKLMQDEVYGGGTITGFRVTGLPAGQYQVFVLHATPTAESRTASYQFGVCSSSSPINAATDGRLTAAATVSGAAANDTTWIVGRNYRVATLTTASSTDYINVIVTGGLNPGSNGIQIVQFVPEPASLSLLVLGGLALLRRRK